MHQAGGIARGHRRHSSRDQAVFDPWHPVPVLARKPGVPRSGAPSRDRLLPSAPAVLVSIVGSRVATLRASLAGLAPTRRPW